MNIDVVSIFVEYFQPLRLSLVGKAIEKGIVDLQVHDLRDWTTDQHRTVGDTPYGGGAGVVMRPEPWGQALDALTTGQTDPRLLDLSASGRILTQALAHELAAGSLIFACGRYEGIDARVVEDAERRMRVGELDVRRLRAEWWRGRGHGGDRDGGPPPAWGDGQSGVFVEESHSAEHDGLLEGPVYKPPSWRGLDVPRCAR